MLCMPYAHITFQSTHPVRGATHESAISQRLRMISIHAPREGCDRREADYFVDHVTFQSTHPVRGATTRVGREQRARGISIHAPREGCDLFSCVFARSLLISIHAPREGCDRKNGLHISKYGYSTHPTASIVPYDSPAFSPICESAESICQQITHS